MTLTLKMANQFLCMTHRLMIIHHHTKFGEKNRMNGSGNTVRTRSDTRTDGQTVTVTPKYPAAPQLRHGAEGVGVGVGWGV